MGFDDDDKHIADTGSDARQLDRRTGNRELPIWRYHDEIMAKLMEHNRLMLSSETGSGKTTQLPQMLWEVGFAGQGKIYVVQNRVGVAVETCTRVTSEMHLTLGREIGYLTGPEKNARRNTNIVFMTAGVFANIICDNPLLEGVSVVIFDEFDERFLQMDIGAALTEKAQDAGSPVKMVPMSATLNVQRLAEHFGGAPTVEAEGRPFHVEPHFEERDVDMSQMPRRAAEIASDIHQNRSGGDILIFMPGKAEINETIRYLERDNPAGMVILPLHGELSPAERKRVFQKVKGRKVIVSTNIAERGLTIDGVKYVIDSGLERTTEYDPVADTKKLVIGECAQDSLKQRGGRAGRTQEGDVFYLMTQAEYQSRPQATKPEIMRTSLRELVLQIKAMGYSREGDPIHFIDYPAKQNWKTAKRQLRLLGALNPDDETHLSPFGVSLAKLGCDPREGAMLLHGSEQGMGADMAVIAAIRTARPLFYRPQGEEWEADAAHHALQTSSGSDLINLLRVYREAEANGFDERWCKNNYVSWRALKEVRQNVEQLIGQVRREGYHIEKSKDEQLNEGAACEVVLRAFPDKIFFKQDRDYFNPDSNTHAQLARESSVAGDIVVANELIVVQKKRGGEMSLITVATAVTPENLLKVFPTRVSNPIANLRYDSYKQTVVGEEQLVFDGVIIKRETKPVAGEQATGLLATLLAEGRTGQAVESANRTKLAEITGLAQRAGRSFTPREHLVSWYTQRLEGATNLVGLEASRLTLDNAALSEFLGEDVTAWIEKVKHDFPDAITIEGQQYPLTYEASRLNLRLPVQAVLQLKAGDLPDLGSRTLRIEIIEQGFSDLVSGLSVASLELVQAQIRDRFDRQQRLETDRTGLQTTLDSVLRRWQIIEGYRFPAAYGLSPDQRYRIGNQLSDLRWQIPKCTLEQIVEMTTRVQELQTTLDRLELEYAENEALRNRFTQQRENLRARLASLQEVEEGVDWQLLSDIETETATLDSAYANGSIRAAYEQIQVVLARIGELEKQVAANQSETTIGFALRRATSTNVPVEPAPQGERPLAELPFGVAATASENISSLDQLRVLVMSPLRDVGIIDNRAYGRLNAVLSIIWSFATDPAGAIEQVSQSSSYQVRAYSFAQDPVHFGLDEIPTRGNLAATLTEFRSWEADLRSARAATMKQAAAIHGMADLLGRASERLREAIGQYDSLVVANRQSQADRQVAAEAERLAETEFQSQRKKLIEGAIRDAKGMYEVDMVQSALLSSANDYGAITAERAEAVQVVNRWWDEMRGRLDEQIPDSTKPLPTLDSLVEQIMEQAEEVLSQVRNGQGELKLAVKK